MAFTFKEKLESGSARKADDGSITLEYYLDGVTTYGEAIVIADRELPYVVDLLYRQEIDVRPIYVDTVKVVGQWDVIARYGVDPPRSFGIPRLAFSTVGGNQHISHSRRTVARYPVNSPPPDNRQAIGASLNGIDGLDIPIPVFNFEETHVVHNRKVTNLYKHRLFHLTGSVNNDSFRYFRPGECLFLGVTASLGTADLWDFTFHFSALPNEVNSNVAGIIITKEGWQYAWVLSDFKIEGDFLVQSPVGVYVEEVFRRGNFALLGIGT